MESGFPVAPRRLSRVLIDSLYIPMHRLQGLDVARRIGLDGDWVVRTDADYDVCMSYVQDVVRKSGYPTFRVNRLPVAEQAYEMRGTAKTPTAPIQILPPYQDVQPTNERSGTIVAFGKALSAAIRRPVTVSAEPKDLKITWRDNSRGYLDLGGTITDEMVSDLLEKVSEALGVSFRESEVEMTIWKLELNE